MQAPVVVCGGEPRAVESGAELVAATGRWQPLTVLWPDVAAFEAAQKIAGGYLVLGPTAPILREILASTARRPVIAIGGEPDAQVDCWLPTVPPAALLATLLGQLLRADSEARSYRRKSDMIVGSSPAIRRLLHELDKVSPSTAPVLITGESGTGKELVARALHYTGPRALKSFVAINCGAIPEALFEAELFGYERGAFTGAVAAHPGAMEAADGGTLFLDEIGELPMAMQVKLLRALETQQVQRLGGKGPLQVNIRLVSATHRDLEAEVAAGRFRQDLYYRVRVFHLKLPPLRARPEDIPELVTHHLSLIAQREKKPPCALTPQALERVLSYPWPGNVRELANALHRAVVLAAGERIDAPLLDLPTVEHPALIEPFAKAKEGFEAGYYRRLLSATRGNISLAAKLAQKTRKEVYDALRRLGLDAGSFR